MLLSDADLRALTGYRRPSAQVRWLADHGIPAFAERRHGKLRLVVRQVDADKLWEQHADAEPDFSALAQRSARRES